MAGALGPGALQTSGGGLSRYAAGLRHSCPMPALFRRREVILPTLWGWLLVLGLLGAAAIVLGRHVGAWLAVSEPAIAANGGPAELLVVEGWLGDRELDDAAAYAQQHGYRRVATSGGPMQPFNSLPSFADRAALRLQRTPAKRAGGSGAHTPHQAGSHFRECGLGTRLGSAARSARPDDRCLQPRTARAAHSNPVPPGLR